MKFDFEDPLVFTKTKMKCGDLENERRNQEAEISH